MCSAAPLPKVKATLVVCPLVAVIQWRSEIARFTAPGSVKVLVYHGPKRNIDFEVLSQYDIVSGVSLVFPLLSALAYLTTML